MQGITLSEREIYRQYDAQRRLNLTRGIAAALAAILFCFIVVLNIDAVRLLNAHDPFLDPVRVKTTLIIANPLLLACTVLFVLALDYGRRQRVSLAAGCTIVATDLAVVTIELTWAFGLSGFDFVAVGAFAALNLGIILAGILGGQRSIIFSTLLINAVMAVTVLFAHPPHPAFENDTSIAELALSQRFLIISGQLLLQWAFTAIMLTAGQAYERIMRDLGDTRVAYERARQLDDLKDQFINSSFA